MNEIPMEKPQIKKHIIDAISKEIEHAKMNYPAWPTDPLHAFAILNEEIGELQKEVLQNVYEPKKTQRHRIKFEAIQAAAMIIRFLESIEGPETEEKYIYQPSEIHYQD